MALLIVVEDAAVAAVEAALPAVERAWQELSEVLDPDEKITPVTYINSAADLKAFCGRHGGIVCTSSNARAVLDWAFERRRRVLFFPDQHLGRNTSRAMGIGLDEMAVWNPHADSLGGNAPETIRGARVILWQGHCSVHAMFRPEHVHAMRKNVPDVKVLVHPECAMEVVDESDLVGSTSYILRQVEQASPGTKWAIGTELHLVKRLAANHPEQEIRFLSPVVCMCAMPHSTAGDCSGHEPTYWVKWSIIWATRGSRLNLRMVPATVWPIRSETRSAGRWAVQSALSRNMSRSPPTGSGRYPAMPLHAHCLFKLGLNLGEIWWLKDLAHYLRDNKRSRFLLTAPPLRLPGAVGSPATPVATV